MVKSGVIRCRGYTETFSDTPRFARTNWMDNAFKSKMKVPFYGKHPYEMNK